MVRDDGSHKHFKKQGNPNIVTVPQSLGSDVAPGTLSQIRRKSGLDLR